MDPDPQIQTRNTRTSALQFHGSIYGVVPAKRGFAKIGEWNSEEIIAKGPHIQVILNGTTIVDADINEASKDGTMDHKEHPGLKNPTGHIGFLGHGSILWFRNIQVMDLKPPSKSIRANERADSLNPPFVFYLALYLAAPVDVFQSRPAATWPVRQLIGRADQSRWTC
jgi:hypothetical protein